MKRTLIAILILIVATAAFAAQRRGVAPGAGQGPGQQGPAGEILPPQALAEFLDLTETQIEQTRTIREAMRTAVEPLRDQIQANRKLIEAALDAGDAAKAGELMLANHRLHAQIQTAREAADAQFEALLTSEQKAKWAIYKEIAEMRRDRGPRD